MQKKILCKGEIKVAAELLAVQRNVKLDSLASLSMQVPKWAAALDVIRVLFFIGVRCFFHRSMLEHCISCYYGIVRCESAHRLGVHTNNLHVSWFNRSLYHKFERDVSRGLAFLSTELILGFLVVPDTEMILSELVGINGGLNRHWIPCVGLRTLSNLVLSKGATTDVLFIDECCFFETRTSAI